MRNYFSIQRLTLNVFRDKTHSGDPYESFKFYEVDFAGADEICDQFVDYYNIPKENTDRVFDQELYFEIDRFIVTRLLNVATFPQLDFDENYFQKTSPRYVWSHNR
jgi:hypothetical protein